MMGDLQHETKSHFNLASTSVPELKQLRYLLLLPLPLLTRASAGGIDGVSLSASSSAQALGQRVEVEGRAECPTDFLRIKNLII